VEAEKRDKSFRVVDADTGTVVAGSWARPPTTGSASAISPWCSRGPPPRRLLGGGTVSSSSRRPGAPAQDGRFTFVLYRNPHLPQVRCAGVEGPGPDPSPPVGFTRPGLPLARPGRARSLGVGEWLRARRYRLRCRRRLHADQDDQRHHLERLLDRRQPVAPCSTSSNGPNDSASCLPQPTGPTKLRHTAATNSARQSAG
jgi:hypothetical protein